MSHIKLINKNKMLLYERKEMNRCVIVLSVLLFQAHLHCRIYRISTFFSILQEERDNKIFTVYPKQFSSKITPFFKELDAEYYYSCNFYLEIDISYDLRMSCDRVTKFRK